MKYHGKNGFLGEMFFDDVKEIIYKINNNQ